MQQQHHRFDGDLWFILSAESSTAIRIATNQVVNIAFSANDSWVSVTGHAELTTEQSYIDEMWDPSVEAWFPGGRTDPAIRALIVHTDSAEYWDTPGSTIATVFSLVKSKVTGTPMEIDNEEDRPLAGVERHWLTAPPAEVAAAMARDGRTHR